MELIIRQNDVTVSYQVKQGYELAITADDISKLNTRIRGTIISVLLAEELNLSAEEFDKKNDEWCEGKMSKKEREIIRKNLKKVNLLHEPMEITLECKIKNIKPYETNSQ